MEDAIFVDEPRNDPIDTDIDFLIWSIAPT